MFISLSFQRYIEANCHQRLPEGEKRLLHISRLSPEEARKVVIQCGGGGISLQWSTSAGVLSNLLALAYLSLAKAQAAILTCQVLSPWVTTFERLNPGEVLNNGMMCREGKITSTIIIGEVLLVHVNKHVTTETPNGHVIVDLEK